MAFLASSLLNSLYKDCIGVSQFANQINDFYSDNISAFPPYNIVETEPNKYSINIATAGYNRSEIEIKHENNTLYVYGKKTETKNTHKYLYTGIALRNFERKFLLQHDVKVLGAEYNDGILSISLERIVPEPQKPNLIMIK